MDAFVALQENDERRVAVRGRPYSAGSRSEEMPAHIPAEQGPVLAWRRGEASPAELARDCRPLIDGQLRGTGTLWLRGMPLRDRASFNEFMAALGYAPHSYEGGIAVRARDAGHVLVASQEDARITMAPHNEMAYLANYPRKVFFFCAVAAQEGGEVPINDVRDSVHHIPEAVLNRFADQGIRYQRYLPRESTPTQIGWCDTFGTSDAAHLEALMRAKGHDTAWDAEDGLTYSYTHAAFLPDPSTGEPLWFNQVTELHSSYWRDHPLFASDGPEGRYPATTAYGNGDPIAPDLITSLRAALWKTSRAVAMRPGDVLVLDNTHIQHGRFAFTGPRAHFVSLTQ